MRGRHWGRLFILLALMRAMAPEVTCARDAAKASDSAHSEWLSYGGDAAQDRFSSLSIINRKTIQRLGLKWALDLPNETNFVATPLMTNGILYFPGKFSVVYAVDARTGSILWSFDPKAREALDQNTTPDGLQLGDESGSRVLEGQDHCRHGGRTPDLS